MIVIVPRVKTPIAKVINQLAQLPVKSILQSLAHAKTEYLDENVRVFLPKFTITSDLILNTVLDRVIFYPVIRIQLTD